MRCSARMVSPSPNAALWFRDREKGDSRRAVDPRGSVDSPAAVHLEIRVSLGPVTYERRCFRFSTPGVSNPLSPRAHHEASWPTTKPRGPPEASWAAHDMSWHRTFKAAARLVCGAALGRGHQW